MEIKFDNNGRKNPVFKDLAIGTVFSMCDFPNGDGYITNLYIKTKENITIEEKLKCNAVQLSTGQSGNIANSRLCRVWDAEIRVTDAKNIDEYV